MVSGSTSSSKERPKGPTKHLTNNATLEGPDGYHKLKAKEEEANLLVFTEIDNNMDHNVSMEEGLHRKGMQ